MNNVKEIRKQIKETSEVVELLESKIKDKELKKTSTLKEIEDLTSVLREVEREISSLREDKIAALAKVSALKEECNDKIKTVAKSFVEEFKCKFDEDDMEDFLNNVKEIFNSNSKEEVKNTPEAQIEAEKTIEETTPTPSVEEKIEEPVEEAIVETVEETKTIEPAVEEEKLIEDDLEDDFTDIEDTIEEKPTIETKPEIKPTPVEEQHKENIITEKEVEKHEEKTQEKPNKEVKPRESRVEKTSLKEGLDDFTQTKTIDREEILRIKEQNEKELNAIEKQYIEMVGNKPGIDFNL